MMVAAESDAKSDDDWARLIAVADRPSTISAQSFRVKLDGEYSTPVVALKCDDGNHYAVKGRHIGRAVVNEHVVARLGVAIGAPVAQPVLVHVPQLLIDMNPAMRGIPAGIAHGCIFIEGCGGRTHVRHVEVLDNRSRLALLAVLFGWAGSRTYDLQLIYGNEAPHLVYSVDHGGYIDSRPNWEIADLTETPDASPDSTIMMCCGFERTTAVIYDAISRIRNIDDGVIAQAVAGPPDLWGLSLQERVALARYFADRRDLLVATYGGRQLRV